MDEPGSAEEWATHTKPQDETLAAELQRDADLDTLVEILRKIDPNTEVTRDNAIPTAIGILNAVAAAAVPLYWLVLDLWAAVLPQVQAIYEAIEETAPGLLVAARRGTDGEGTPP